MESHSGVKVRDVLSALSEMAPIEMKMDFDNVGLLAGFPDGRVRHILVSLDITGEVVDEAYSLGAELVVSHHPLFFTSNRFALEPGPCGRAVRLVSAGISAICMHTNLDAARGGVNDALAEAVGLIDAEPLAEDGKTASGESFSYGRRGRLREPMSMGRYLGYVKERLASNGLRYHDARRPVYNVGVVGGSGGGDLAKAVKAGCDTFLTADIKYDVFLEAKELGVNLIDADHFCTENTDTPIIERLLRDRFPGVETSVSKRHAQTAQFF